MPDTTAPASEITDVTTAELLRIYKAAVTEDGAAVSDTYREINHRLLVGAGQEPAWASAVIAAGAREHLRQRGIQIFEHQLDVVGGARDPH